MAKNIKIKIDAENKKFNIPAIPLSVLSTMLSIVPEHKFKEQFKIDKSTALEILKEVRKELKHMDPFVLVDIDANDNGQRVKVYIEVK